MAEYVREVVIAASPEVIYGFLTETDKYLQWEGIAADLDPRPGGIFSVDVSDEWRSRGEFVELVPFERIVHTFGWEDQPVGPGSTTVEYTLEPEGDKTRLRVRHSGLPEDAVDDHAGGWTHYMDRLAVVATGGDPGPDLGPGS